ncbi:histidine phosphatase family protein [Nocardioides caricicola]|uniref:Histidine phosphatase family protein n=1 Tax=Nocardioides caricicola TaxID=634770 RepID=A0ABW0MV60_9ACTN
MGVVILVRHGQASFGADDYDVLSETGWEQGRLLGRWLPEPSAVVAGGMRRHRETAEAAGWSPEIDAGWDEFDHLSVVAADPDRPTGELDRRQFQRAFEQATARWTSGGHDGEYAESWPGFVDRVRAALDRACARAGSGETVAVVTSGGPIAVACAAMADPDADAASYARLWNRFNTTIVNSSFTRVVVGSTGARLLTFNEHPHLDGAALTYR